MNKNDIQEIFQRCSLGKLGDSLSYKLWIKGFDAEEELLEDFLLTYDIGDDQSLRLEEFLFHFQIFTKVRNNFSN